MADTWEYAAAGEDPAAVPVEWVWERLRLRRDQLLSATDYRVIPDAPWPQQPWIDYRQALRDMPANTTDPRRAVWPTPPMEAKR